MSDSRAHEIEIVVESVRVHMRTGRHVLLMKEVGLGRILPIWIGQWEAQAIAMRLQGIASERPLTHDLFLATLEELGVHLERVVITSLADETFHAVLVLEAADGPHEVDARPSDAIALAVREECPIFAAPAVLDQAAALPDPDGSGRGRRRRRRRGGGRRGPRRARGAAGAPERRIAGGDRRAPGPDEAVGLPGLRELAGHRGRPAGVLNPGATRPGSAGPGATPGRGLPRGAAASSRSPSRHARSRTASRRWATRPYVDSAAPRPPRSTCPAGVS